jgi:uncharacterized protein YneF (UPF0154 family)
MSKVLIVLALLGVAVAGFFIWRKYQNPAPDVTFAAYGDPYASKTDFAQVEYEFPLTKEQRMKLTPQNIQKFDQEQVDQIYARLTAGPIPDGPHDGDLFFPKGITGRARLAEIVGKVKGVAASLELEKLTILGKALWMGKVFYRDERVLRNRINHLELLAEFFVNPGEEAKVRELSVNGKTDQLYFPAKLYCGQSLLDSRRESIIIDYAFTDEIAGYHEIPDKLAGREGLLIRDEIRMVRPGFYLGRAYMGDSFLLNFTVYKDADAKAGSDEFAKTGKPASEDCWVGPQKLAATP